MKNILKRVQEHYEYLISLGYEVVCTILQGSQNYNLDEYSQEYQSDIDTKSIVLPNLDDVICAASPISETIVLENNEHAEIKDIRVMFEMFKKAKLSYIELLYSDYIIINPRWAHLITPLFANKDLVSSCCRTSFLKCIVGMAYAKQKALCHPYPSLIEKIKRYGYDGKQLSHCARLYDFISRYVAGVPIEECYKPACRTLLMNYKKQLDKDGLPLSKERAIELCDYYCSRIKEIKDNYLLTHKDEINEDALDLLDKIKYNIIKEKMKGDIKNENAKITITKTK